MITPYKKGNPALIQVRVIAVIPPYTKGNPALIQGRVIAVIFPLRERNPCWNTMFFHGFFGCSVIIIIKLSVIIRGVSEIIPSFG